jgi:hypothetical protein
MMMIRGCAQLVVVAIATMTTTKTVSAKDLRGQSHEQANHQTTVHGKDLQAILHKTMANQHQKKQQQRALIKADQFKNEDVGVNFNNAGPGQEVQFFAVRRHTHTKTCGRCDVLSHTHTSRKMDVLISWSLFSRNTNAFCSALSPIGFICVCYLPLGIYGIWSSPQGDWCLGGIVGNDLSLFQNNRLDLGAR